MELSDELPIYIAAFVMPLLFILTVQQLCVSPLRREKQDRGALSLRIIILLALICEITLIIVHRSTASSPFLFDALSWALLCALSIAIYKMVDSPKHFADQRWSVWLLKSWICSTILYCFWLTSFLFLIMTNYGEHVHLNSLTLEMLCRFGLNVYIVVGALTVFTVSANVWATINKSISNVHLSIPPALFKHNKQPVPPNSPSGGATKAPHPSKSPSTLPQPQTPTTTAFPMPIPPTSPSLSHHDQNGENPQETLIQLSRGKCIACWTITICIMFITISISEIAIKCHRLYRRSYYNNSTLSAADILDHFHYLFVFLLYISGVAKHWIPSSKIASHHSAYSALRKWFCPQYALPDMLRLKTHSPATKPSAATLSTNTLETPSSNPSNISTTSNPSKSPGICEDPLPDLQILDGISNLHDGRRQSAGGNRESDTMEKLPNIAEAHHDAMGVSMDTMTADGGQVRSGYPARKSVNHTLVSYTQYTTESKLALSPLHTALNRVGSDGKLLGKRGAPKPRKLKDRRYPLAQDPHPKHAKKGTLTVPALTEAPYNVSERSLKLSHHHTSDHQKQVTEFNEKQLHHPMDESITNTEDWVDGVLHRMESTVNTVVFDLDHVLCTNTEALQPMDSEQDLKWLSPLRKQLCFGGADRIETVKEFLTELHKWNSVETLDRNLKCFIISKESSRLILRLLKDVGLLRYFVSAAPSNPQKLISHIIGSDHIISKESQGRTHLILLQLMQSLERSHDEVLHVSQNRNEVEHLKAIKICRTDWCETRGLTANAMNEILDRCCLRQPAPETSLRASMSATKRDESTLL